MSLMRRGALFAGALFAGVLFGPQVQEVTAAAPAFDAASFSAPRPRAHVVILRAACQAIEAERAQSDATQVLLISARGGEADRAAAGAWIVQTGAANATHPCGMAHAVAASRLDSDRAAAMNNQALASGLL